MYSAHSRLDPRPRALLPLLSSGLARLVALMLLVAVLLAWQLVAVGPAYAKAGDLDPTFGTGGKVTTDIDGSAGGDQANALVAQADGKLVAAGSAFTGTNVDFALARYLGE